MTATSKSISALAVVAAFSVFVVSCRHLSDSSDSKAVVTYAALDEEYSKPIFGEFTKLSGIEVRPKYDTESTKTVGLAQAIIAERQRPRCDVFWNNEILHTLRLEKQGLLAVYRSPAAKNYDEKWTSPNSDWHAFAARARILIVNRDVMKKESEVGHQPPSSIYDLGDSHWRGRVGMAKPLFGTTATHAACLFAKLGPAKAKEFFNQLKANDIVIESGNKQVATAVGSGQLAFGLTDTDDAMEEIAAGSPVEIIFPDQAADGLGTLLIPNTLAIIKDCPHPEAAHKLIDYLLSAEVETKLVEGSSAQIPLNHLTAAKPHIPGWRDDLHWMDADFAAAADQWEEVAKFLRDEFTR